MARPQVAVFLGTDEDRWPELASLQPGECALIVEPGEVSAEGVARPVTAHAQRC